LSDDVVEILCQFIALVCCYKFFQVAKQFNWGKKDLGNVKTGISRFLAMSKAVLLDDVFMNFNSIRLSKSAHADQMKKQHAEQCHVDLKSKELELDSLIEGFDHVRKSIEYNEEMMAISFAEDEHYLQLHNKIWTESFNSKVATILTEVLEAVSGILFLNVDHVVKGGSLGKGVAISGVTQTEAIFFLKGVPLVNQRKWLPGLLRATATILNDSLANNNKGVENVHATEDSVQVRVEGNLILSILFAPMFESTRSVIKALTQQDESAHRYYRASLMKQTINFVAQQPEELKMTMRLVKWWRDQQEWSSKMTYPSDELLELTVIYSAWQNKPSTKRAAIKNVMSLLESFDELRIVWPMHYSENDVWPPLLSQRPLLMDPANPYVNVADPQSFDSSELMAYAWSMRPMEYF